MPKSNDNREARSAKKRWNTTACLPDGSLAHPVSEMERKSDNLYRYLPFPENTGIELIIRLQIISPGIFQLYILHIFCKFSIIGIPENQLPGISGKFHIETIYNLF